MAISAPIKEKSGRRDIERKERKPVGKATLASAERKNVMFAKWKKDQFRKERKIILKLWRIP